MESSQTDSIVEQLGLKLHFIYNRKTGEDVEMEVSDSSLNSIERNKKQDGFSSQRGDIGDNPYREIDPDKPELFDGDITKLNARIAAICQGEETSVAETPLRDEQQKSDLVKNLAARLQKIIDG